MENNVIRTLDQAIKRLENAREELERPEEDVVSFLVCKNAQYAIENFLKAYLLQNDIDPAEFTTVESLYKKCLSLNKNFADIDLTGLNCKAKDMEKHYCDDISKVSTCYKMAHELNSFLRREQLFS